MKKSVLFFSLFFFILLTGCSQRITEEDLIGGNWVATAGYEDGETGEEPNCYPFEDGLEFKDKEAAYNESFERNFEYILEEEGEKVTFFDVSFTYSYQINKISENEIVLEGLYTNEGEGCTLERN